MKKITDYAELVKAKHALNKTIAPVEDGANIAGSYTSGKQFIREGVLYTALTTIAENTAWSSLTLDTDYELADDLTSQLASLNQTLTNNLNNAFDVMSKNGAKNLLPISLETYKKANSGFTWNNNVATANGLTITFNEDGTFVINNTSSNWLAVRLISDAKGSDLQWLNGKKYSGIKTGSTSTYLLRVSKTTTPWTVYGRVTTEESIISGIPNNDDLVAVDMYIFSGQTFNNLKVEPMVRLASDIDDTYEPYAMTNRELTDELSVKNGTVTWSETTTDNVLRTRSTLKKYGKVVNLNIFGNISIDTANSQILIGTLPSGYRPVVGVNAEVMQTGFILDQYANPTSIIYTLIVMQNGNIKVATSAAITSTGDSLLAANVNFFVE